ncbi:diphthamide biosynthesis protein 2, putative (DPH2) [Plasmodium ovale curtisi]|uniref:Diphthamide biosynthesis protein 2, putative (DPH2) n=1 Tax=Plasmodium ovale curtisi TaxID=864141 RepID=A0A1A8W5N5_PLAOA|nr:diphthamide biosynthesis protein 2, putative (DPH2) [Plasmodium ovale curtisi]
MAQTKAKEIAEKYELELVTKIILNYNFKNVAIQLPDCMLNDSLFISSSIQDGLKKLGSGKDGQKVGHKEVAEVVEHAENGRSPNGAASNCCSTNGGKDNGDTSNSIGPSSCCEERTEVERKEFGGSPVNLYVLGDTTLNECCEDYVSADHVHADFLVHYGISCQSFIAPYIPSVYIFNKKKIQDNFFQNINEYLVKNRIIDRKNISILLCDVSYINCLKQLVSCFVDKGRFGESTEMDYDVGGVFFGGSSLYEISGKAVSAGKIERGGNDHYERKNYDHERKNYDHERKNYDHERKNYDHERKNYDHERKNYDHERKNYDHERKNYDEGRRKDNYAGESPVFTNVVVCLHRIANNMKGKVCYGFFDSCVQFDVDEKILDEYAFLCGRLLFKVFYCGKKKRFIYKVVKKEDMLPKREDTKWKLFLFSDGKNNFLNRSLLEHGYYYDVYIYNEENVFTKKENSHVDKLLLRRYNLIEKCKEINMFGIIIGNVNLKKNKEMKKLINYILRRNGKKCFTIVTNKLNSAKLENFYDIEMYILLTCPENNFVELKDFSKKIINPYEFFVAYGYVDWQCSYILEFSDLLNINSVKKEWEDMHKNKYFLWNFTQESLSLKNGHVEKTHMEEENVLEKYEHLIDYSSSCMPVNEQRVFISTFDEKLPMCQYFLETLKENSNRDFTGVDMNYNIAHIPTVVQGLHGIAQRYDSDVRLLNGSPEGEEDA